MNKDIRTNGLLKVLAKILVSFLALGIVLFGAALVLSSSASSEEQLYRSLMYGDVDRVTYLVVTDCDQAELDRRIGSDVSNLRMQVRDDEGKLLYSNGSLSGVDRYERFVDEDGNWCASEEAKYILSYGLLDVEEFKVEDKYAEVAAMFGSLKAHENLYVVLLILCVLFFILDVAYLFSSTGHKKGQEGIAMSWIDAIPLDILAVLTFFFTGIMFVFAGGAYSAYGDRISALDPRTIRNGILLFALFTFPVGYAILEWLLSLARHIKAGKWYNSLLCVQICRFLILWTGRSFAALRYEWRVVLAMLVNIMLISILNSKELLLISIVLWVCYALYACWGLMQIANKVHNLKEGTPVCKVDEKHLFGTFKNVCAELTDVQKGVFLVVERQVKAEKLRTELITNVSHDIKTPLTSIINYVDLLQKEHTPEQEKEYLEVLSRNSDRLKRLTEDLIESSKASSGSMNVDLLSLKVQEILDQAVGEYEDKLEKAELTPIVHIEPEDLCVVADGRLLWRVLSNLLSNCVKYAMPGTRIYIDAVPMKEDVQITVKNISKETLNISAEELMERFVRQDKSRSTTGSGLGLDIAKSLTILQKGSFDLQIDGDLFKARITLPRG